MEEKRRRVQTLGEPRICAGVESSRIEQGTNITGPSHPFSFLIYRLGVDGSGQQHGRFRISIGQEGNDWLRDSLFLLRTRWQNCGCLISR